MPVDIRKVLVRLLFHTIKRDNDMFCSNCGKACGENEKFCSGCGAALNGSAAGMTPNAGVNPFADSSYPSSDESKTSIVKWVVIGILAIIVLGFAFDMIVLSKASSDADRIMKHSDAQYNRAMKDYNKSMDHLKSMSW